MKKQVIALIAVGVIAFAGCASPSDADNTACKLLADADNTLNAALNVWTASGESDEFLDSVRNADARLPEKVREAASIATGDLAVEMRHLADAVSARTEDGDLAYYYRLPSVYEECKSLGVKLDIIKMNTD